MPGRVLVPITMALLAGSFACLLFAAPALTLQTLPEGFTDEHVTSVPHLQR